MARPGAVRHKRDGVWVETDPHDQLYSTALMCAEEVFTENGWEPAYGEITDSDAGQV